MAHFEEVQTVELNNISETKSQEQIQIQIQTTADCPSGLYSDLPQDALMKVRSLKLQEFLAAKQRFDEVEMEVRTRAWRRSMKEKGDDLQARIERQRLEAEAIGKFSIDEAGMVRGAPRDSSFGSKRRTSRVQARPLNEANEAAMLEFLASLEVD